MLGDPGTIYLKHLKLHMNKLSLFLGHSVLQKLPCLEEASSSSCKISQVFICLSGDSASLIRKSLSCYFSTSVPGLVILDFT